MSDAHLYCAVEAALSDEQKALILERWEHLNPHQKGAHVADILDLVRSCDGDLEYSEPWWEEHGDKAPIGDNTLWAIAIIAVVWFTPGQNVNVPSYEAVAELVGKVEL